MTVTKARPEEITLEDAVDQFLEFLESSNHPANTIGAYQADLAQLVLFLQGSNLTVLSDVGEPNLLAYFQTLQAQKYSNASLQRKRAALKSFLGYLSREGISELQVSGDFPSFKIDKTPRVSLTAEEVRNLFEVASNCSSPFRLRDYAMLVLSYSTGLRATELVSLRVEQVRLDESHVQGIRRGRFERQVPFSEEAGAVIASYVAEGRPRLVKGSDNGALFLNDRGTQIGRQWLFHVLKEYGREAGIYVNSSVLRNTFAVDVLSRGTSLSDFNELLGNTLDFPRPRYIDSGTVPALP